MPYIVQLVDARGVFHALSSHNDKDEAIAAATKAATTTLPKRPGGHGTVVEVADDFGQVWSSG